MSGRELVVLLGANGAGKTTIFRALSGLTRADGGSRIEFAGRDLATLSTRAIVDAGMSHCPEGRKLFPALSVGTNLRLGAYRCDDKTEIEARLGASASAVPTFVRTDERSRWRLERRPAADGCRWAGPDGRAKILLLENRRSAWRRKWLRKSSRGDRVSIAPVQWCCFRNRMRTPRSPSPSRLRARKRPAS